MKILFVNLPGEEIHGGVELFLKRLTEILKSRCEVKLLSHLNESDIRLPPSEEKKYYGVIKDFHDRGYVIHIHKLFSTVVLKQVLDLKNIIMTLHDSFYACAQGKLLKHAKGQKRECLFCAGPKSYVKYKYRLKILQKCRLILTPSSFLKGYLKAARENLNVKVLPHFFYDLKIKEEEIHYGRFAYFLGRLEESKGVKVLLDIFKNFPYKLVIQGKGTLENKVRAAAKENENIIYEDDMSENKIYENYKECLFSVMPSLQPESFGLSGFEGYNFRKPCAAFNYGGVNEWLKEDIGFLCPQSASNLKEKLSYLFENSGKVKEKGQKGLYFLKSNFSASRYVENYIETLKEYFS